jgi:antitoxin VapB
MHTTRIFMNGGSQAVRLPAECRFEEAEVCVARVGAMVLIFPKGEAWRLFESAVGSVGEDFGRPAQGKPERDPAALDPTPGPRRRRVYRKGASGAAGATDPPKATAKRPRKSA